MGIFMKKEYIVPTSCMHTDEERREIIFYFCISFNLFSLHFKEKKIYIRIYFLLNFDDNIKIILCLMSSIETFPSKSINFLILICKLTMRVVKFEIKILGRYF